MKASKQRKIARAIVSKKALKSIDAKRLTDMQGVVEGNKYKHERKIRAKIRESFSKIMESLSKAQNQDKDKREFLKDNR